jgi:phage baseplate assembly protein gpV
MQRLQDAIKRLAVANDAMVAQPRFGIVSSVDGHSVKVIYQPEGVLSGWMPVPSHGVNGVAIVIPPSLGDQLIIDFAHGDHEQPYVAGRIFSDADPVPASPVDQQALKSGEFGIIGADFYIIAQGGQLTLQSTTKIKMDAPQVEITGDVTLSGTAAGSTGKLVAKGDISDAANAHGTVADLRGDYNAHAHPDVQTGEGMSGTTTKPTA